jgi:hypothetical protein
MRGMPDPAVINGALIYANTSGAETSNNWMGITATGFYPYGGNANVNASANNYIYIAIRRGPMKVPTDATTVYNAVTWSGNNSGGTLTSTFSPDFYMCSTRTGATNNHFIVDRLRSPTTIIYSNLSVIETGTTVGDIIFNQTSVTLSAVVGADTGSYDVTGETYINHFIKRAPSFFDEVCDTGTGASHTISHNLSAVPELILRKSRSGATQWEVYCSSLANTEKLILNSTAAKATDTTAWNSTTPSNTTFTVGTGANVNTTSATYVSYLFATCAGVSKVGSYTGTGATQTIACGFTGGARFVLVKRTDTTGGWYVWDTARGMVAGTDPSLLLNSTAVEVNANSIYTTTGGFQIVSTAAGINASGGSYIFLAIA